VADAARIKYVPYGYFIFLVMPSEKNKISARLLMSKVVTDFIVGIMLLTEVSASKVG
jgi:hypothetical protein